MITSQQFRRARASTSPAESRVGRYAGQWAALLTTYRRDGEPVSTPVNVVVDGDRILFRTYAQTGKFERLERHPRVSLQLCDARGRVTDDAVLEGVARLLSGDDDRRAGRLIDAKYPVFQRGLVRLVHRLARYRTVHFAIDPADEGMLDA